MLPKSREEYSFSYGILPSKTDLWNARGEGSRRGAFLILITPDWDVVVWEPAAPILAARFQ
jgi:hypothetical protein